MWGVSLDVERKDGEVDERVREVWHLGSGWGFGKVVRDLRFRCGIRGKGFRVEKLGLTGLMV